ncbi:MAG: hypothetical protein JWM31_2832 [Solirubrobacterales bacterium]|nr:hypothetical protein [Solirubrobacterales bacterium]
MSLLSKRTSAPLAVLALAAVPLAMPMSANAAMGGALTLNSTISPDLISATITGSTVANGTTVRFCYNKTIGTTPVAGRFFTGTYDQLTGNSATTATAVNGNCVDATFAGFQDLTTDTYATDTGGGVISAASARQSNADSTALIGSNTNNGTRARSTAPDLVGVTTAGTKVSFTFDEILAGAALTKANNAGFAILNSDGTTQYNAAVTAADPVYSADGKTITVDFTNATQTVPGGGAPATAATVANAVRGLVGRNVVTSTSGDGNPISSAALPGKSGATDLPDPLAAELVGNGGTNQILVTFDQPIGATAAVANYKILLSDGTLHTPNAAVPAGANAVTLSTATGGGGTSTNLIQNQAESIVGVEINKAAVATNNTQATVPTGGNAGALATGFTIGPEALATTFQINDNSATVTFDQRYFSFNAGQFRTVDNTGTLATNPATSLSFGSIASPGQTTIKANFNSISGARGLQIRAGGVQTYAGGNVDNEGFGPGGVAAGNTSLTGADGAINVTQILAPSASNAG